MAAKRVTMRQIAEAAGVSRTTVSFILNNVPGMNISPDTRQRILDIARDLHYVPDSAAQSLARGRAGVIALVVRQSPHQVISNAFLAPVIQGVAEAVRDKGYHILIELLDPSGPIAWFGDLVRSRRADGIILTTPILDDTELNRIIEYKIPVVLMGQLPDSELPFVEVDNVQGAKTAVSHLVTLGHKRIACITNAQPEYTSSQQRLKGYQLALEAAGIPYDPALVRYGDFTPESGDEAIRDILNSVNTAPSAVFVASDVVALGVLGAIQDSGYNIPDDIALVSFDDIPLSKYATPPLTTLRLPAYSLGWGAGQMLTALIDDPASIKKSQVFLKTELIIRKSCGARL